MTALEVPTKAVASPGKTSRFNLLNPFKRDYKNYEGVPRINIYLLRILFTLMFVFVAFGSWNHIASHQGRWESTDAAAWCMWGAYSAMSVIGIFRPLKMLPIVMFEIIYKVAWLIIAAYPLWVNNELAGSDIEPRTKDFIWVILPIIAMPWGYFFRVYIMGTVLKKTS